MDRIAHAAYALWVRASLQHKAPAVVIARRRYMARISAMYGIRFAR